MIPWPTALSALAMLQVHKNLKTRDMFPYSKPICNKTVLAVAAPINDATI